MEPRTTATAAPALVGHVALSWADAKAFNDSGELRPEIFSQPGVFGQYVPLDTSVEYAIETALLQTTSATFDVVERDTKWYVLKLTFAGDVIADMFQSGRLHWSANMYRMELWSQIKAEWILGRGADCPKMELIEVPLRQMSWDDWGDRVLTGQFCLWKWSQRAGCEHCLAPDCTLWQQPRSHGEGSYCALCWHAHCKSRDICESLHELHQRTLREMEEAAAAAAALAHVEVTTPGWPGDELEEAMDQSSVSSWEDAGK